MAKAAAETALPTLRRNIYFYRAEEETPDPRNPGVDIGQFLVAIDRLNFDTQDRYHIVEDGNALACWIDDMQGPIFKARLGLSRRSGLPKMDKAGQLSEIRMTQNAGLAEQIHVVFFPDGVVGCDFNFYAPRLSKLTSYFKVKLPGFPIVLFRQLVSRDSVEKLNKLISAKAMTIKFHKSLADKMKEADRSLASALDFMENIGGSDNFEITISAKRGDHYLDFSKVRQFVSNVFAIGFVKDELPKFKIVGFYPDDEKQDIIDLISDKLISTKDILASDPKSRALEVESAYAAIVESYNELKSDLENARSVSREFH